MKISVIAPVKNEAPWIGYSIMAAEPYVHEFIYNVDPTSDDGTIELLDHLKGKLGDKLKVNLDQKYAFNPLDTKAYNQAFRDAIDQSTGDACWYLHPDMIVTKGADLEWGPLAWWTLITSYAGDFNTIISKGRATRWKNIHAKKFGLTYCGGYGLANEDFYHSAITGNACKHYGEDFSLYPYEVSNSGIAINHYCELKSFKRRFEKMKVCLKAQHPSYDERVIETMASHHPRVILESVNKRFGEYEFSPSREPIPEVITKYKDEFESFKKELTHV